MERWKLYVFAAALFAGLTEIITGSATILITGLRVLTVLARGRLPPARPCAPCP